MALKKVLVLGTTGEIEQLQPGDTVDVTTSSNQVFIAANNTGAALTIGQAVYISAANTVEAALADNVTTSGVVGLVADASIADGANGYMLTDGTLASTDWTAVVGATTLTAGSVYFLSDTAAGELTTTVPTAPGSFVTRVGTAINTTTLEVTISRPIKL